MTAAPPPGDLPPEPKPDGPDPGPSTTRGPGPVVGAEAGATPVAAGDGPPAGTADEAGAGPPDRGWAAADDTPVDRTWATGGPATDQAMAERARRRRPSLGQAASAAASGVRSVGHRVSTLATRPSAAEQPGGRAPRSAAGPAAEEGAEALAAQAARDEEYWRSRRQREPMPAWLPRAIGLFFLGLGVLYLSLGALRSLKPFLLTLLVAVFLSLAIEPAVNWLVRHGFRRRGSATLFVFALLALAAAAFSLAIGALVVDQGRALADNLPTYLRSGIVFVNQRFHTHIEATELIDNVQHLKIDWQQVGSGVAGSALGIAASAVGLLFQAFTVALFTFYLVADGPRWRRAVCSLVSPERQRAVLWTWDTAIDSTGSYIFSRSLLAALSALAHFLFLTLIGVPNAAALGLFVGVVSQFVPTVGTYLAGALPILVALANKPVSALWVLLFVIGYQQVENYLFAPRIAARTMNLNAGVSFAAVLIGAALLGPIGALLALPAAAMIQAVVAAWVTRREVVEHPLLELPEHLQGTAAAPPQPARTTADPPASPGPPA